MKPDLTGIKNIIFDLGNVIVNLDFDASIRAFQDLGFDKELLDHNHVYADPVFYKLEVGEVSPEEFRHRVREVLNNQLLTDEQIDVAWSAMMLDTPAKRVRTLQTRKNITTAT